MNAYEDIQFPTSLLSLLNLYLALFLRYNKILVEYFTYSTCSWRPPLKFGQDL